HMPFLSFHTGTSGPDGISHQSRCELAEFQKASIQPRSRPAIDRRRDKEYMLTAVRVPASVGKDAIESSDGRETARSTTHLSRRQSEKSQRQKQSSPKNPRTARGPCCRLNSKSRRDARTASKLKPSPRSSQQARMRRPDPQSRKQLPPT